MVTFIDGCNRSTPIKLPNLPLVCNRQRLVLAPVSKTRTNNLLYLYPPPSNELKIMFVTRYSFICHNIDAYDKHVANT